MKVDERPTPAEEWKPGQPPWLPIAFELHCLQRARLSGADALERVQAILRRVVEHCSDGAYGEPCGTLRDLAERVLAAWPQCGGT
jgi:hypothetical protein